MNVNAPIRDVVQSKGAYVHSVSTDAWVIDAIERMNRHHIGAVMVTEGAHPVGIFTERDVLRRVAGEHIDPATVRVSSVMSTGLDFVSPTMTVGEGLWKMTETRHRHLPVMDRGRLVGLVSLGDLTYWAMRELESEVVDLYTYIHSPAVMPTQRISTPPPRNHDSIVVPKGEGAPSKTDLTGSDKG